MGVSSKLVSVSYRMLIPMFVTFELTRRCLNKCRFCYIDTKLTDEISFDEVKRVLDELYSLQTIFITFTGGEPLLRDDIVEIIKLAREKGFYLKLFSSLSFECKDKLSVLYDCGLYDIEVSLHGLKETHNYITQRDCFDKTVENILFAKRLGFRVVIKTPVTKLNICELPWVKRFAKENDMVVNFDPVITSSEDGYKKNSSFQIDEREFKWLIDSGVIELGGNTPDEKEYFSCGALRNIVGIRADGDVVPCIAFPYVVGNVKKERFYDIWFSQKANFLRDEISNLPKGCMECYMRDICGRCPGVSYSEKRNWHDIYDLACVMSKVVKDYI